ncbi:LOW QUALITY PROTEIN: G patch domain-containing protein 4 [Phasianus colchicus]|uniref:LOW QUALITY PROTEIN: G patch domain-containing protein 4 n=1 Tax=Phasianus colchicus TaxID=9054 RepID=UPI00129E7533|nr:LOW QUALITY PROTEIN: G patch domain-containing protein 4 [Phasianus colchicus]
MRTPEGRLARARAALAPPPSFRHGGALRSVRSACAQSARRGREESVAAMSAAEPLGAGLRFAERQLRRHGWTQGRGLGKREDGIARPIRPSVKCGTAGVGHDAAEQFSFHWWDHVFNEAAANIAVRDGQDGVCVEARSEQRFGVSTKKPHKVPPPGSTLYGHFIKAATLTAHGEEPTKQQGGSESSEEEEEDKLDRSSARRLTDEELVRVCGGRTAHKGARHGLTMSAKLARLEEQERAFLAAKQHGGGGQPMAPQSSPPAELQESRKKKKKKKRELLVDGADVEGLQSQEANGGEEEVGEEERRKKKKKKRKEKVEEVVEMEVPPEDTGGPEEAEHHPGVERKKKKKKKRRREAE